MSYDIWGRRQEVKRGSNEFAEKSWRRSPLAAWDQRWETLSVEARAVFLEGVKAPKQARYLPVVDSGTPVTKFRPEIVKELTDAGFMKVEPALQKSKPDRFIAVDDVAEFRVRVRALQRIHVLDPASALGLEKYINVVCQQHRLVDFVSRVLRETEPGGILTEEEAYVYLKSGRWPDLAVQAIKDPLARQVLDVVRASKGPVALASLPASLKKSDPARVRAALDALVSHLAVFEDLNVKTHAIEVGLLPEVRKRIESAASRSERPPLVVCRSPRDLGPDTGPYLDDLRAFMLEVASDPPRLRQDGEIFSKETERFYESFTPMSAKFWEATSNEERLSETYDEAETLKLVKEHRDGKELRLQPTSRGSKWLSSDPKDQYAEVFESFRSLPKKGASYYDDLDDFDSPFGTRWYGYYPSSVLNDRQFLGGTVSVALPRKGKAGKPTTPTTPTVDDVQALREAIGRALMELPEGVYHTLNSVVEHHVFRDKNILLMGHAPEKLRIFAESRPIPALEESREQAARKLLTTLLTERLIPLGCMRVALDDAGVLCIARTHRLGPYFGLGPMTDDPAGGAAGGSKVVVQPDFSVVVIGLSTAVLAELAPFCERTGRGKGPGAEILKITRDSVVRAIAQGLKVGQILDRLRKHTSHEPPANVLHEVREWGGWVKSISTRKRVLIDCPDRETADRVVGVLRKQVERLNDTVLALDSERLTPADRKKLRDNGVLIGSAIDDDFVVKKAPAKYKRSWGD